MRKTTSVQRDPGLLKILLARLVTGNLDENPAGGSVGGSTNLGADGRNKGGLRYFAGAS